MSDIIFDSLEKRMAKIESTLKRQTWMLAFLLAGVGSLVLKAFF